MSQPYEDPFENPTPRQAKFASAASFRGRLVMIEPTLVERDIPKKATAPNGAKGDRVTANVTTMDGLGPVPIVSNNVPTGQMLEGPLYRKVWFSQDQIADGLQSLDKQSLKKRVLARIDTLKPGQTPGEGNPWILADATPAEREQAIKLYAEMMLSGSQASATEAAIASTNPSNPWAK